MSRRRGAKSQRIQYVVSGFSRTVTDWWTADSVPSVAQGFSPANSPCVTHAHDAGEAIKSSVEGHDPLDVVDFHHRQVERIASR